MYTDDTHVEEGDDSAGANNVIPMAIETIEAIEDVEIIDTH